MGPIGIFWFWIIAVALRSANCETKISGNGKDVKLPELLSELDLDSVEASEEDIDSLSKIVKRLAPEKNGEYQVYQVFFGNEELLKEWLQGADKGQPGVDYPMLTSIPPTKFNCKEHKDGYYGDAETNCQVFHICDNGRKISFLCPNGTIFQQSQLICDWWFKVDCSKSAELYEQSAEQLAKEERKRADKKRMNSEFHRLNNDNTETNNNQQYQQQNSGGKQTAENNNYGQASRNQLPGTDQRSNDYKNPKSYDANYNNNQQTNKKTNNQQINNYPGVNSFGPSTENINKNNLRGRNYQRNQLVEDKNDKYNNDQRGVNKYSSQVSQNQNQDHADNYYTTTTIRENLRQSKSRKNQYEDNEDETNRGATPAYIETTTFRTSTPSPIIKEYQQPAESAAFVSQRNRYNKIYPDQFNSFYNNNNNNVNNRVTLPPTSRKNSPSLNAPQNILKPREQIPDFPHSTFNPIFKPRTTTTESSTTFGIYPEYLGQKKNEYLKNNEQQKNTTPYITTQDYRTRNQDFRTTSQSVNTESTRTYQDISTPGTSYTERAETTTNTDSTEANTQSYILPQTFGSKKSPNNNGKINYESLRTTTTTTIRPFLDLQKVGQTAGNPTQPINKYQDNVNNNKFNNYDQNSLGTTQSQDLHDGTINQVRAPLKSTIKISQNIHQNNVISSTEKPLKNQAIINQQNIINNNNNRASKAYDGSITYQNGKTQSSTVLPYIPFTKNYAYVTTTTTSQKPPTYTATVPTFTGTLQYRNGAKLNNNTSSKFKGSASAYLPNVRSGQNAYLPKKGDHQSLTEKQHALNMLKSLKGLEGTMPTIIANNNRNGLTIPHSSSPATLHSLALYFAQNSAEQTANEAADLEAPPLPLDKNEKLKNDSNNKTVELPTSILTQHTINSYVDLFNLNNALDIAKNSSLGVDVNSSNDGEEEEDDDDDQSDDLDRQQSEGPVSGVKKSNSTKLRELAQVFTHALSAYLQDPDTFKKILTEIRPTEPAPINEIDSDEFITTTTTMIPTTTENYPTTSEDYPSVTKEKDEVLDFSEDITGPRRRHHHQHHHQTTTEIPTTTTTITDDAAFGYYTTSLSYSDSNLPTTTTTLSSIDSTRDYLNPPSDDFASVVNREFSNGNDLQSFSGPSGPTSNENENYFPIDYNDDNRSGKFLKNSTSYQPYGQFVKPTDSKPIGDNYESSSTPSSYEETFPPNHQREELTTTTTTTEPFRIRYYDTTTVQSNDIESLVTANSIYSGNKIYQASTLKGGSLDKPNYNVITQQPSQSTNPVTKKNDKINNNKDIENKINDHWTSEPVTQLWESNVFVDPHHINHGLTDQTTTSIDNYTDRFNPTTTDSSAVTSSEEILVTDATNSIKPRNSKQYNNNNNNNNNINSNNNKNNNDIDSINNGPSTPWEWAGTENEEPTAFTLLPTVHLNEHTATPAPQSYTPKSTTTTTTTTTTITSSITTKNNKPNGEIYSIIKTTNKRYKNNNIINGNNTMENEMVQAKEMFGNLNDTSSATLMKVMKTADNDVTVRQLILLLISHCSGPMNKTKENERDELLNELLKMPVNEFSSDESREIVSGINRVSSLAPIVVADTEIRRASLVASSTEPIVTTYRSKKLKRGKINVNGDDDDDDDGGSSSDVGDVVAETVVSDGRALELLRSLYTIAAKWG